MNRESAERALNKIKSLLSEEGVNELTIERQYLLEIFSHELLELSPDDGLPILILSTRKYLSTRGIITTYKGKDVKFSKSLLFNIPGVKAAMMPLHIWAPDAYSNSPMSFTAIPKCAIWPRKHVKYSPNTAIPLWSLKVGSINGSNVNCRSIPKTF